MTAGAGGGPDRLPAAVLWDLDGTLVDTEPSWFAAEFAVAARHGGRWSDQQARDLIGADLRHTAATLQAAGVRLETEPLVDALIAHVVADVREHTTWRPGARELLAQLAAAGVPQALVTMSWTSLVSAVVSQLPVGTFATLVTGDRLTHGKPHPEPYLTACRELGVAPADCVAVEDSRTGVASAQAAGVPTIGVPNVLTLDPAPGRRIVASLTELTPATLLAGDFG